MSETVNAILYEGYIAVLMPDERPIKHVVLESPSEKGMQGDLSWRYYMPESYTKALANENAKLRELILDMLVDEERGHNDDGTYYEHVRLAKELGIGADE